MFYYGATMWEYMEGGFKFYVDEQLKRIVVSPNVTSLDIKSEVYSALKDWFKLYLNSKYDFPIRSIGGDATVTGQFAGDMYFLINGYRMVYDPTKVAVSGILFSDDYDTPWLYSETLNPVYPASVSNLALAIQPSLDGLSIPTAQENADAVWDDTDALTKSKFIALK